VLLDYGDWVAHIFSDESRKFYDLERLWKDMPRVPWAE
jgi:ribosome-associated protein